MYHSRPTGLRVARDGLPLSSSRLASRTASERKTTKNRRCFHRADHSSPRRPEIASNCLANFHSSSWMSVAGSFPPYPRLFVFAVFWLNSSPLSLIGFRFIIRPAFKRARLAKANASLSCSTRFNLLLNPLPAPINDISLHRERFSLAVEFRARWCDSNDSRSWRGTSFYFHAHSRYRNLIPIDERKFRTNEF